jgi:hypothetical protein
LVEGYEALRRCVLSGRSSAEGLAIVLEHGVAAWAEVCSALLLGAPAEPKRSHPPASPRPPEQLSRELVDLMAQMVFSNRKELRA